MYLNRYGHAGIPVVVFASSVVVTTNTMILAWLKPVLLLSRKAVVQFFTLSSVDSESWLATWKNGHDQAEMHRVYERYVIDEAIPFYQA